MRLLLDFHALVRWCNDDPRLPDAIRQAIADPAAAVFVSAASAWKIATRQRLGKWPGVNRVALEFETLVRPPRFSLLGISPAHTLAAGSLDRR